ncbi:hypothetical protein HYDPIDRAFT_166393 [Hydnomerulius pinastri MD-312]|nr:hypothetical protein HYDPIDRAFT_166393 [Hydnomerulius pinastri MD-312]
MPASVSPLALIIPRPQIPSTIPRLSTPSSISNPRTPNRSPVASHIFFSPPPANRNSTDSWNSSNYDLDDPNTEWKEDEIRLLTRPQPQLRLTRRVKQTLDALPAHLITPFNGSVPPSNLLDKIARGITAAKGPNDWPHSVRATRIELLALARLKAQHERHGTVIEEGTSEDGYFGYFALKGEKGREGPRTPEAGEVLQPRTNTPVLGRRPLYRQSSMDFMSPVQPDRSESIARLQRQDRTLHHPYLRPAHLRRRSEHKNAHSLSPSTPSSSTLNSNHLSYNPYRKSTASATSASTSSFGSPMSTSAPLRPSSLRRASTITLDMHVDDAYEVAEEREGQEENLRKGAEYRRSGGYAEVGMGVKVGVKVKRAPDYGGPARVPATPSSKPKRKASTPTPISKLPKAVTPPTPAPPKPPGPDFEMAPRTPPTEPRTLVAERSTPNRISAPIHAAAVVTSTSHAKKPRKGHKPQLSLSSDEEDKIRSKSAKKARTREPSWSVALATPAPLFASPNIGIVSPHIALGLSLPKMNNKEGSESGRSGSTGRRSSKTSKSASTATSGFMSSRSSTDNDLSTASTDTAATSVSASSIPIPTSKAISPAGSKPKTQRTKPNPNLRIQTQPFTTAPRSKPALAAPTPVPARRTLGRNPSMFGAELPCPQPTPASPSRIPVSSPAPVLTPSVPGSPVGVTLGLSPAGTPALSPASPMASRPRTLRRAARRISFGPVVGDGQGEGMGVLGSWQFALSYDGESYTLAFYRARHLAPSSSALDTAYQDTRPRSLSFLITTDQLLWSRYSDSRRTTL